MPDTSPITSTPDTPPPSSPPKPGYKTTEFWLALAAKILGGLFAAGLVGDGGTLARIAGLAAIVLTSLGYTVSRGMVKAAAALLLLGLFGGPTSATGCTKAQLGAAATAGEHSVVNCTGQALGAGAAPGLNIGLNIETLVAIANTVAAERSKCSASGSLDWKCVETDVIREGEVIGGCALVQLFASSSSSPPVAVPAPPRVAAAAAPPDPGRAALEDFRARVAGGATFHTSAGDY